LLASAYLIGECWAASWVDIESAARRSTRLVAGVGVAGDALSRLLDVPSLACHTSSSSPVAIDEPDRATTRTDVDVNAPPWLVKQKKKKKKKKKKSQFREKTPKAKNTKLFFFFYSIELAFCSIFQWRRIVPAAATTSNGNQRADSSSAVDCHR
jgi:hypothetical protein